MPRRPMLLAALAVFLIAAAVHGFDVEFNWVPSGSIDVGDRASEASAMYEANGDVQKLMLAYRGENSQEVTGRMVAGDEAFVIRPAPWRFGPAPAHLVICRTVDTAAVPGTLAVSADGQHIGDWTIQPPPGERRLFDTFFVIPRAVFPDRKPPAEVRVTISGTEPSLSLGYRFYATRDWDLIGPDWGGDIRALTTKAGPLEGEYLAGLLAEGGHDWRAALTHFRRADALAGKDSDMSELARLARVASRRMELRMARAEAAASEQGSSPGFETHYQLGLLAGAWGCWQDALHEFELAVQADPAHADATYRLAEAMEYCRMPVERFAPVYERAGILGQTPDCNVENVLVAIHTEAVEGLCHKLTKDELEQMQRNWRYVEQMLYGASLGAWKLNTTYQVHGPGSPEWVMQAGWIFLPPEEAVDFEGQYGYSIGTAGYGSSHSGGVDCGVRGAGGAQIGPTRGWEVWMHEWNHQFDWVSLFSETGRGYPVTHDSDGCGKQPIVSMGCGHRSSMRYYMNRGLYRRHRAADPVASAGFIDKWALWRAIDAPGPSGTTAGALARWLVESGRYTQSQVDQLRRDWDAAVQNEKLQARNPPPVASYPPREPIPPWSIFIREHWNRVQLLDELAATGQDNFVAGRELETDEKLPTIAGDGDFVDLLEAVPGAADKCIGYVRTFVYSPEDREARLWLGCNDTAALWLSGRKLTSGRYYACAKWEDRNRPYMLATAGWLKRGWNCLALKVERGGGDWGFSVHVVDFDNRPIDGLKVSPELPTRQMCNRHVPPAVGPHYRWADVKDDYLELLPRLSNADLATLTGVEGLTCDPHRFLLRLPKDVELVVGSRYVDDPPEKDAELNNCLNWDRDAAAALRFEKDGQVRDLLLVRPEYYDEFLTLLHEADDAWTRAKPPAERLLGYIYLDEVHYATTPNRPFTYRAVLAIDAMLGDYPPDDLDLLAPPTPVASR